MKCGHGFFEFEKRILLPPLLRQLCFLSRQEDNHTAMIARNVPRR
jgi:hypothetical protein